ncbi:hypothetical protein FOA52_013597 [Chlamydomonas sp. UWO 241]|nr:hypothetical protein FOA52_013597 [Chlamydomonas sp. UWO 241]
MGWWAAAAPLPGEGCGFTLNAVYVPTAEQAHVSIDLLSRRRERDVREICEAAAKLGMLPQSVRDNIESLEMLLPDLVINLDKMRASEWAAIASDVKRAASVVIVLKSEYPSADVSKIIARAPKVLLQSVEGLQNDAAEVKAMLAALSKQGEIDAIIEAVPYLLSPKELHQSLANLAAWFPSQDPVQVLSTNPSILLNVGEADLPADPLYGEEVGFY